MNAYAKTLQMHFCCASGPAIAIQLSERVALPQVAIIGFVLQIEAGIRSTSTVPFRPSLLPWCRPDV